MRFLIGAKTVQAVLGFTLTGAAFTIGNLLLARQLSTEDYGHVTLALAVFTVTNWLGPLGFDQVLLRRVIDPNLRLLARLGTSSVLVAAVGSAIIYLIYGMPVDLTFPFSAACIAGSIATAAGLALRRYGWTILSLIVTNITSVAVLTSGLLGLFRELNNPLTVLYTLASIAVAAAIAAWSALALNHRSPSDEWETVPKGEAASLLIVAASGVLIIQIERLLIPPLLSIADLATYSVIASVAVFPFRLMRSSSGFAIVPRLRNTADLGARLSILKLEGKAISVMLSVATLVVVLAAPAVATVVTGGRYPLGTVLVLAGCLNGGAKLVESVPRSALIACGTAPEIRRLGLLSWAGVLTNVTGAYLGSFWGLPGLIFGGALGSMVGSLPSFALARRAVIRGYVG